MRALNLVDAIIASGQVRQSGRVAIVGGGAAGLTAATSFALAMPELQSVDVYEAQPVLLHLQAASAQRYLHPHIYDWPEPRSLVPEAGLPILDWSADVANGVASHLHSQFEMISGTHRLLNPRLQTVVTRVQALGQAGCRIFTNHEPAGVVTRYDAVILTIGFGYEHGISDRTFSYWAPMSVAGPAILAPDPEKRIFVSGNGDGGLVDFLAMAFAGVGHREICEFLTGYPGMEQVCETLLRIEHEAWERPESVDLLSEYRSRLRLPDTLLMDVADRLRADVRIVLHTREARLFRCNTAILNRFAVFLALEADSALERHRFEVVTGVGFSGPTDASELVLADGRSFSPSYRFLRLGVDREANLRPFAEHAQAWTSAPPISSRRYRPATPELTNGARERFEQFRSISRSVKDASVERGIDAAVIRIETASSGRCVWKSNVVIDDIARLWSSSAPEVRVLCDIPAGESLALCSAIGRLVGHCDRATIYASDYTGWRETVTGFVLRAKPGPNVDVVVPVRPSAASTAVLSLSEPYSVDELANELHSILNRETLRRLNEAVLRCLAKSPTLESGLQVEESLRAKMRALWQEWHIDLERSPAKQTRFLTLLAALEDHVGASAASLLYVGPKSVKLHLTRSTILAVAVAVVLIGGLSPREAHPGNLTGKSITAHASGISWMNRRDLGLDVLSHNWTTSLVVLSELPAAAANLRAARRSLNEDDDRSSLRISDVSPDEESIIIGADFVLKDALTKGEGALDEYIADVIRARASESAKYLEQSQVRTDE